MLLSKRARRNVTARRCVAWEERRRGIRAPNPRVPPEGSCRSGLSGTGEYTRGGAIRKRAPIDDGSSPIAYPRVGPNMVFRYQKTSPSRGWGRHTPR
eukprot:5327236-Pyramimonas_sp.AAC.1